MPLNQLNVVPMGVSPRHTLSLDAFSRMRSDLLEVGHIVIDNCFSANQVKEMSSVCGDFLAKYEKDFREGKMSDAEREAHLNSTRDLPASAQKLLTRMLYRSQFLDLLRFLLGSNTVVMFRNDQCLRKIHADYPLRSVGLHHDTQFVSYVNRTFTLWLPLTDVLENSPTILYAHRSLNPSFDSIDPEIRWSEKTAHDEQGEDYEPKKEKRAMKMLEFIKQHSKKTYAPRLKIGSAIVFCHDVLHGTFMNRQSKGVRHSIDCRFSVDFDRSMQPMDSTNKIHTLYTNPGPASAIRTILFRDDDLPVYAPHDSHPDIENGTPTYEGYSYARKHDVDYDFAFYEETMPDVTGEELAKRVIYDETARRLLRLKILSILKEQKESIMIRSNYKKFITKIYNRCKNYWAQKK